MHDGAAKIEPEVEFEVMMNQFFTALEKIYCGVRKNSDGTYIKRILYRLPNDIIYSKCHNSSHVKHAQDNIYTARLPGETEDNIQDTKNFTRTRMPSNGEVRRTSPRLSQPQISV